MNLTIRLNETQRQIIAIGLILFVLSICYVPLDQTYWIGFRSGDIKSGFQGGWTWITALGSTYTYFGSRSDIAIPATISFTVLAIEWLLLCVGCVFLVWINRDKLTEELGFETPLSDKAIVDPVCANPMGLADDLDADNQLQESEIRGYKSLEEFIVNRPDISRDQCEALWDCFKGAKSPKGKSCSALNPATAWPFPKDGG